MKSKETLKNDDIWWPWPLVKVTVVTRNLENIHFLTISQTKFTVELWNLAQGSLWRVLWWPCSVYCKFEKKIFLTIFYNILDTIYSTVMRRSQKVAWGETFKTMGQWVTLTFGQGHSLYLNVLFVCVCLFRSQAIHSCEHPQGSGSLRARPFLLPPEGWQVSLRKMEKALETQRTNEWWEQNKFTHGCCRILTTYTPSFFH